MMTPQNIESSVGVLKKQIEMLKKYAVDRVSSTVTENERSEQSRADGRAIFASQYIAAAIDVLEGEPFNIESPDTVEEKVAEEQPPEDAEEAAAQAPED